MEIWINPACSKCQAAQSLLDDAGVQYTVRRYLDDPPSVTELEDVLGRLGLEPWDVARTGEPVAAELGLADWPRDSAARQRWLSALAAHPILIQRPIITADDGTTVIGRSADAVRSALPRHRESRATVRVLVIDDTDRILLLHDSDLGNGVTWWLTPGGGIDPGESELDAVVRELAEETGLRVDRAAVLGPIARRHVRHGYTDKMVEQDDTFYALRVPAFEPTSDGHTEEEQLTVLGSHWWTRAELARTTEQIWPVRLLELWSLVDEPARWPVALETVEESSLPID